MTADNISQKFESTFSINSHFLQPIISGNTQDNHIWNIFFNQNIYALRKIPLTVGLWLPIAEYLLAPNNQQAIIQACYDLIWWRIHTDNTFTTRGLSYYHGLMLITAWISDHTPSKVWNENT